MHPTITTSQPEPLYHNSDEHSSLLQRFHSRSYDLGTIAHHLASHLAYFLQLALGSNCRVGVVAWSKLTYSGRGEAAFAVIGVGAGACGEDGDFDVLQVLGWGEEDEFVAGW